MGNIIRRLKSNRIPLEKNPEMRPHGLHHPVTV